MKKSNKYRDFAIKLVKKFFNGSNGNIISIKEIHNGYTNISFAITFANKKTYQVRIPHCGDLINRNAEYEVLKSLGDKTYVYFDAKTGVAIKEWITGKNPKIGWYRGYGYLDNLFSKIKQLHQLPIKKKSNLKATSFDQYNQYLYHLNFIYQQKYLNIIDTYQDDKVVINHTDINPQNLIVNGRGTVFIIDYEWVALAPDYWDYANFIREAGIRYSRIEWSNYIENFDMDKLRNYIFLTCIYAYLWTWAMPQTKKILRYRRKVMRQIYHYSHGVIKNKNDK